MCSYLHHDSKPIKKEGIGHKIFKNINRPLFTPGRIYECKDKNNFICWNFDFKGDGFCFFLNRKEAVKCLNVLKRFNSETYNECFVKKIEYKKGLGKHIEDGITKCINFKIALCKQFKIIED